MDVCCYSTVQYQGTNIQINTIQEKEHTQRTQTHKVQRESQEKGSLDIKQFENTYWTMI